MIGLVKACYYGFIYCISLKLDRQFTQLGGASRILLNNFYSTFYAVGWCTEVRLVQLGKVLLVVQYYVAKYSFGYCFVLYVTYRMYVTYRYACLSTPAGTNCKPVELLWSLVLVR